MMRFEIGWRVDCCFDGAIKGKGLGTNHVKPFACPRLEVQMCGITAYSISFSRMSRYPLSTLYLALYSANSGLARSSSFPLRIKLTSNW